MKLIKINTDHYVVVDDSEIKKGDWTYHHVKGIYKAVTDDAYTNQKKITHSTQPLEYTNEDHLHWDKIKHISLQEVKELIGEKSWKGYIDGTEWEVEIVDGKLKLK